METIIKFLLIFSFAFSMLFKLLNYLNFYRLYKASCSMSDSGLDIIRQIKRRFSDCITLGKPIENTESFIRRILLSSDKYNALETVGERISIGFLLIFWGILWFSCVNGFFSYERTILFTVISMALAYISDRAFDICAMESGFITYAADYLDNTLKGRQQKAGLKRGAGNLFDTYKKASESNTSPAAEDEGSRENKSKGSSDKAEPEIAAAADTELITSIIDEFIL